MRNQFTIYLNILLGLCFYNPEIYSQNSFTFSYLDGSYLHHYNLLNKTTNTIMCENVQINTTNTGGTTFNSTYQYDRIETPYPFSVEVPYIANVGASQSEVSPISIIDPMVCRFNNQNSTLNYTGGLLIYPKTVSIGQLLPAASGSAIINGPNGFSLSININVTNRQVVDVKDLQINGQTKKVFAFYCKLHYDLISQGAMLKSVDEIVLLQVINGGGIYSIDRTSPVSNTLLQFLN